MTGVQTCALPIYGLLGVAHAFGGRFEAALSSIEYARRLSPRDTFLSDFELYNAFAYFAGGRYDVTLQYALQAHRLRPGHAYPLILAASAAGHLNKLDLAETLLNDLKGLAPIASADLIEMSSPYVLEGDRARLIAGLVRAGMARTSGPSNARQTRKTL